MSIASLFTLSCNNWRLCPNPLLPANPVSTVAVFGCFIPLGRSNQNYVILLYPKKHWSQLYWFSANYKRYLSFLNSLRCFMQNCQSCMLPDGVYPVGSFYTILIPQSPSINIKLSRLTFFNMKPPGGIRSRARRAAPARLPGSGVRIPAVACVLSTSAFFLFTGQRILLFSPHRPGTVHFSLFLVYWTKNSAF